MRKPVDAVTCNLQARMMLQERIRKMGEDEVLNVEEPEEETEAVEEEPAAEVVEEPVAEEPAVEAAPAAASSDAVNPPPGVIGEAAIMAWRKEQGL